MYSFIIFLTLVIITSSLGTIFRPGPWYDELVKPALTPPGWIFTPVWLTLYLMIAIAGWIAWQKTSSIRHPAVVCWGCQLVLNAMWSWLFFGLQSPVLALLDIFLLLLLILAFIMFSWQVSRAASILFMPYALWVGFAAYLNLGIVLLN